MEHLPRPAPENPLPLVRAWLAEAEAGIAFNPWAMALASVSPEGRPSVRYVLLKALDETAAHIVFYTNYGSRKAAELDATGHAAAALYWPAAGRQLRFEGPVSRSPTDESDAYFASRPRASQLNAWASEQSRPLGTPDAMAGQLAAREREFEGSEAIPRPAGWGGYRLGLEAVEFWTAGDDRFHERLRYSLTAPGRWASSWLQP